MHVKIVREVEPKFILEKPDHSRQLSYHVLNIYSFFFMQKDDPGGKKELDEVADNLRHWKDNCAALGYDSDGERMSQVIPAVEDGSERANDVANRTADVSAKAKGAGRG